MERWKVAPLPSKFPKVEVSSLGRVRYSNGLLITAMLRASRPTLPKYWAVWLRFKPGDDGRARWWVHDLVLETFVGLRPEGMTARYKDRDVMNLSVDNLEWAPRKKE